MKKITEVKDIAYRASMRGGLKFSVQQPLKLGRGLCPFWGGAGSPSNTKSPGPTPTSIRSDVLIHAAIWPQQIWAENWGAVPLCGKLGSSNIMSPGPRPTCTPSFILIRPTVWPQYTNITDRQDNGPIALGEPFYKRSPKNPADRTNE